MTAQPISSVVLSPCLESHKLAEHFREDKRQHLEAIRRMLEDDRIETAAQLQQRKESKLWFLT
jgi:hypothetical protein